MAIHNPVTICGTDSSGEAETVNVTNGAFSVASSPNFVGTAAECVTQAGLLNATDNGVYTFFATDTGQLGVLRDVADTVEPIAWDGPNLSANVADVPLAVEIQTAGAYTYIAEALPNDGTTYANRAAHLAASVWRAQRITNATGSVEWADAGKFTQVATDLTSGITYE